MTKVLIATEKPFAESAVNQITNILRDAGYQVSILEKYTSAGQLKQAVRDVHALIVRSDVVDRELLEAAPELKIVIRAGAGYDNVDLETARQRGIVVMNTPGQNANAVAELAIGMMVYMARNLFNGTSGTELMGKTLGLHAYGHVGRQVARIARGFGMEVTAFDPFIDRGKMENDGVGWVGEVKELYSNNQYVSLHIPANEKTSASVNYELMSLMPPRAVLVNTARKEIIDEASLARIMDERGDFRYVTDVAPGVLDEISGKAPGRIFCTPKKMGAQTSEANTNAGVAAARQIVAFFREGDTTFRVN